MPDELNVDIAHKLAHSPAGPPRSFRDDLIEISEAVVLAVVAVATAWSGYQAAKWNGRQAFLYGTSARLHVEAGVAASEGGQQRLLDVVTFNTWIEARERHDEKLTTVYVNRFSPEYRKAFDAWLETEPFTKTAAPAGPFFMPQYHNVLLEQAERLNTEATAAFAEGTEARDTADRYVRVTVVLATVLFLVALAQRVKLHKVRLGLLLVASIMMVGALVSVVLYPRL
jgi:hypothetical protein